MRPATRNTDAIKIKSIINDKKRLRDCSSTGDPEGYESGIPFNQTYLGISQLFCFKHIIFP